MHRCYLAVLFILLCSLLTTNANAGALGKVSGQLKTDQVEDCRGMVSLWPTDGHSVADPGRYNTIPYEVAELNTDCSFVIEAPPGSYFLRGIIRNSQGPSMGPLRVGDLIFMSPNAEGNVLEIELNPAQPVDVGTHSSSQIFDGFTEQIETGITGFLVNPAGMPVEGMIVQAHADSDMASWPLAVSEPTDHNGRFSLRLANAGSVFLQARENINVGLPVVGTNFGVYGGESAEKVLVEKGEVLQGLEIVISLRENEKPAGASSN